MTSAAANSVFRQGSQLLLGVCAVAAAFLVGSALAGRSPGGETFTPLMAEHDVTFPDGHSIGVEKYEVTAAEWNACHMAGGCSEELHVRTGMTPEDTPATGLNHDDVMQYVAWINTRANLQYRLPTVEEWKFMAAPVLPKKPDPIFTDPELRWAAAYEIEGQTTRALKKKGSFSTTTEGIADLNGSVWEWTDDCYTDGNASTPRNLCPAYYAAGEHIAVLPYLTRDPARGGCAVGAPPAHLGFRLVTDRPIGTKKPAPAARG